MIVFHYTELVSEKILLSKAQLFQAQYDRSHCPASSRCLQNPNQSISTETNIAIIAPTGLAYHSTGSKTAPNSTAEDMY